MQIHTLRNPRGQRRDGVLEDTDSFESCHEGRWRVSRVLIQQHQSYLLPKPEMPGMMTPIFQAGISQAEVPTLGRESKTSMAHGDLFCMSERGD